MEGFRSALRQARLSWFLLLLFLLTASCFALAYDRPAGYVILVPHHFKPLDIFFTLFTWLGDGIFILVLSIVMLVYKRRFDGFNMILSYAISGMIAQILKNIFPSPRPAVLFRQAGKLFYEIPGVTLMKSNASFPSGHTASVFALMTTLFFLYPSSKWNPLWLLLAAAIGYSRIYLGNHFAIDVTAGAFIGVVAGTISYLLALRLFESGKWKYFSFRQAV